MTQIEKVLYTAKTHTTGGRDGASRSSDGRLDIKLSRPARPAPGPTPSNCSRRAGRLVSMARWASRPGR